MKFGKEKSWNFHRNSYTYACNKVVFYVLAITYMVESIWIKASKASYAQFFSIEQLITIYTLKSIQIDIKDYGKLDTKNDKTPVKYWGFILFSWTRQDSNLRPSA